jgi:hypothetical protein
MLPLPLVGEVRMKYVKLVVPLYAEKLVPAEERVVVPVVIVNPASAATATPTVEVPVLPPNCAYARHAVSSRPRTVRDNFLFMVSSLFPALTRYAAWIVKVTVALYDPTL